MLIKVHNYALKTLRICRRISSVSIGENEEYTNVPKYPEIQDITPRAKLLRRKQARHEELRRVKSVEEKQIKLNMPKYYGFKCYLFEESNIPYNNLILAQHITRTHIIQNKLPDSYNSFDISTFLPGIQTQLEEIFKLEFNNYNSDVVVDKDVENKRTASLCKKINRMLINNLVSDFDHIREMKVDYSPRHVTSWFAGGMLPPENIKSYRRSQPWQQMYENEPTDRAIHYRGQPVLTLRHKHPLRPIIAQIEAMKSKYEIPYFKYDPRTVGAKTDHLRLTNIPGYMPGDKAPFGSLSYLNRGHFVNWRFDDLEDKKEALLRQAVLASFGWLSSIANFHGFTTYNDITYPMVTQAIITNGKFWSFFVYQLNTLLVYGDNPQNNEKVNICWATRDIKLYDDINSDGTFVNFNPNEILTHLLQFYLNRPESRLGVNLCPFLDQETPLASFYEDEEKRIWLEREYKFLTSNRNRFKLDYEIYMWEKIYKIDHKTRPMDKRIRPFETFVKPSDRTLDNRLPRYIPRALRPDLPRHKGRYAKEFWP